MSENILMKGFLITATAITTKAPSYLLYSTIGLNECCPTSMSLNFQIKFSYTHSL